MKKRLAIIFSAALLLSMIVLNKPAYSATTQNVMVYVEIPYVFNLDWYINGSIVELTGPNAITSADFLAGMRTGIVGGVLSATANESYDLTVAANDTYFKGPGVKPVTDMLVDIDGAGYIQLDGTNEVVLISNHAAEVDGQKTVSYQVNFNSTDVAGLYSVTLVYTIKPHI